MPQRPDQIIHVRVQEPTGIPAKRFVTDLGFLPAAVPGASGNKILGVSDYAAKLGEDVAVIVSGTAEIEVAGAAGISKETSIAGDPPVASVVSTDNGNFISSDATGRAVAGTVGGATDVGLVAPDAYALVEGDFVEVILKL